MAGLQVGQDFGVFFLPGSGVGGSSPQVPRYPTSMCDSGIKVITEQQLKQNHVREVDLVQVKY